MNTNTIVLGVIAVGIITLVAFQVSDRNKAAALKNCRTEQSVAALFKEHNIDQKPSTSFCDDYARSYD